MAADVVILQTVTAVVVTLKEDVAVPAVAFPAAAQSVKIKANNTHSFLFNLAGNP